MADDMDDEAREQFIEAYYEHLNGDDSQRWSHDVLRERAFTHIDIARYRAAGTATVHVIDERHTCGRSATMVYIVTDDMPFLVDSVTAEIVRQKGAIRLVAHPMMIALRHAEANELAGVRKLPAYRAVASGDTSTLPLSAVRTPTGQVARVESWIAVELQGLTEPARRELTTGLERVLADVKVAVDDWQPMRTKALECAQELVAGRTSGPEHHEANEFLRWMEAGSFTFLGYCEYHCSDDELLTSGMSLGLLREGRSAGILPDFWDHLQPSAGGLVVTKATSRSTVHRAGYLDYVGVSLYDEQGKLSGQLCFIGLFAASVYYGSAQDIPVVRAKIEQAFSRFGFPPGSHSGKDLLAVIEAYPRDELLATDVDDLIDVVGSILRLQERRRTRLFLRRDIYSGFVSAMVFLPRDRYTTAVREAIENELKATFAASHIDFEIRMSESVLARLFFRIQLPTQMAVPPVDTAHLQERLTQLSRPWSGRLREALNQCPHMPASRWVDAFPLSYQVAFDVTEAVEDIRHFEKFSQRSEHLPQGVTPEPLLRVYVPSGSASSTQGAREREDARVKLYWGQPTTLSQILPYFHNLGLTVLDERPFDVLAGDGRSYHLYDLGLKYPPGVDPLATSALMGEAFAAAFAGQSESDRFDQLIIAEQIPWKKVLILRSYAKYLRHIGNSNSYGFIAHTLLSHPMVAKGIIAFFCATFDPTVSEADRVNQLGAARALIDEGLERVTTLDADRVLRSIVNVVQATIRTNYFRHAPYLSIKFDPRSIDNLPHPRPFAEIWVYSPAVEGVHLRFGLVARGGLRWSDRREDFRTEVLGLVKAQSVKNAVIVPAGAKGGFFAKRLPDPTADRAAWLAEGVRCYKIFIQGLLDITDNIRAEDGREVVIPPEGVRRLDGNDAYLVVAADKGTATFSDTANEIAQEYGYWLGDAFASGGSVGFDHKAMGITARGAWESVKSHCGERGVDIQNEDFTVVGIGDMSGDVFGNGMLLSRHIKLIAAFDHRHIFLDPDPDPQTSYRERERLFKLPRSSWMDYDVTLMSPGGGVYPRETKSMPISSQVRRALELPDETTELSPPELLRAILKAPVDLLYNGGIGTYIKARSEVNVAVGDRANDAIRINGNQVRARVIGEGGNLGLTQRGRIEAALAGVSVNTDAIDNSAGVDCSDHEVNIKIFLDRMIASGKLPPGERDTLLAAMTDQVAELVLRDNREQNAMLLGERSGLIVGQSTSYERLMNWLEKNAGLNRGLEDLPTEAELRARAEGGHCLSSPELSVLAAYSKIELANALSDSAALDDEWFTGTLEAYFPTQLRERFPAELPTHPLRRQIIATVLANDIVNIAGITFPFRVMEETNAAEVEVAKAFVALSEIFDIRSVFDDLMGLPAAFPTELWCRINHDIRRLMGRGARWLIHHTVPHGSPRATIERYRPLISSLREELLDYLEGADRERVHGRYEQARQAGAPESLARAWAGVLESYAFLDVAHISASSAQPQHVIAQLYYAIFAQFGVGRLLTRISKLPARDRWQALARSALRDDLYGITADMTRSIVNRSDATLTPAERIATWIEANRASLERAQAMFSQAQERGRDDIASLSVTLRLLRSIVRH